MRVFPPAVIDRDGLHRSNLRGLREALWACQPAEACLVDGFKLGPLAPPHRAVVDGDEKSAAIAAASIVAKVTRDRYMHAVDASIPATASRRTSATSRRRTAPPCAGSGRARSTGARSRRSATGEAAELVAAEA